METQRNKEMENFMDTAIISPTPELRHTLSLWPARMLDLGGLFLAADGFLGSGFRVTAVQGSWNLTN